MVRRYIIYEILNLINNKRYIGLTSESLHIRWSRHKNNAKRKQNYQSILYKAIRNYGEDNFKLFILDICKSKTTALKKEIYWIKKLKTKTPNGYNLTNGGEGSLGIKRSKKEIKFIIDRFSKKVIRSDGRIFKNIKSAAAYTKVSACNISACIYGKRSTCGGFSWKLVKNDPINRRLINEAKRLINKNKTIFARRRVKCLTNGKTYNSLTEAANILDCNVSKISLVCKNKRKSHKGMRFKYVK